MFDEVEPRRVNEDKLEVFKEPLFILSSPSHNNYKTNKNQEGPISDMDKLVVTWIKDQIQKHIPLSIMIIITNTETL